MAKLNDLTKQLGNEPIGTEQNLADLPEQIGGQYPDPPQPGSYRFRIPALSALADAFDVVDSQKGQRVKIQFRDGAELTIIQSPGGEHNGETFATTITNVERKRGKDGPEASDWDYILAALDPQGKKPKTNREYIERFNAIAPTKEFGADLEWSWRCNDRNPIRIDAGENGIMKLDGEEGREKKLGCGKGYYQKDVTKVDGKYPREIECECGALVRGYANLQRIRA